MHVCVIAINGSCIWSSKAIGERTLGLKKIKTSQKSYLENNIKNCNTKNQQQ